MPAKGNIGGSLGAREHSPAYRKKQKRKKEAFDRYCKRKSGPVKKSKLSPDELRLKRFAGRSSIDSVAG